MYPLNSSGGEIDQVRAATRTPSLAADKVFLYCRAAPAARGPSPLAVGLIESHGAGASGSPGRDARMPPGLEERAPGWPAVGRVPADPGRSGAGRRTPARDHPAGPGSDRRPDAPERRGGAGRRGPGSPGYRRVRLPGASRPVPTLRSATREARKNAHTPAVMAPGPGGGDGCASCTRTDILSHPRTGGRARDAGLVTAGPEGRWAAEPVMPEPTGQDPDVVGKLQLATVEIRLYFLEIYC